VGSVRRWSRRRPWGLLLSLVSAAICGWRRRRCADSGEQLLDPCGSAREEEGWEGRGSTSWRASKEKGR
jgi:hypothetical protein